MRNFSLPATFALAIAAILAISLLALGTAAAQEDRPAIDLAVEVEIDYGSQEDDLVIVTNNSEVNVGDVVVDVEFDRPVVDRTFPSTGSFANGKWTIPLIEPGRSATLLLSRSGATSVRFVRISASIASSSPQETRGLEYNNRAEAWATVSLRNLGGAEDGRISVQAEVDDLRPALNGQAVFKVHARNLITETGTFHDRYKLGAQVRITLSPGLSFASSMADTTVSGNTATWRAGDLPAPRHSDTDAEKARRTATLSVPVNLTGSAPLETRCLTAELVEVRPPDPERRRHDEVATVCLGDGPPELLGSGETGLLTLFPCIGVTTYPCSTDDTLELIVEVGIGADHPTLKQRRLDEALSPEEDRRGHMYLQPESLVIHVRDPQGRHEGKWRTGTTLEHSHQYRRDPAITGAGLLMNLIPSGYSQYTFAISDVEPKQRPGTLVIFAGPEPDPAFPFLDVDTRASIGPFDLETSFTSEPSPLVVEFSTLGTHKVQVTFGASTSGTAYTDTVTYTFHVGPVAELEVRDAGASPEVARGKRAYTIEAVNNGPDAVSAAVVTVADVPEGARVIPSQGDYYESFCGENGLCEGVWTVGGLEAPETASLFGQSNSATLTIIAEGDPVTATIESARDYTVCIDDNGVDVAASSRSACESGGNSWHSAEYYDHSASYCYDSALEKVEDVSGRSDCEATTGNTWYSNDRDVRIASQPGTGQGHPDAPPSLRVDKFGPLALLRWEPVEQVNGFDVSHYQVERNGAMLAEAVKGVIYADLQGGTINQSYRVRAVNSFGVPGPWSFPKGASGPLEQPEELGAPTGLTATPGSGVGRIDLSWFAPSDEGGLRYRVEHSTDGAGPWRTLVSSQSGTTYSHTGLISGTTHYYRVAALKGSITSPWAHVQATTEGLQVAAPGWPMNLRFTSVDRTAVTLAWDPPVDDGGSPVTGYEYRVFGPCASGADAVCDVVAPTRVSGTSRRITGLNREGTYEFSVRALNAVGAGDWSQPITKDVGPQTAAGGRVVLSPTRLTVAEGGEATYRVKLSTNPTLPLFVVMHWDGDENLGGELPFQQFKILLPNGYDTSDLPEWCGGVRLDWDEAYAWNVGVPITVAAAEDDDSEHGTLTIQHDVNTLPHDCLNMAEEDWKPDPVYDGMQGPALTVTERDND